MSEPTPAQRAAIEAPLGPVLVVAGPGAGKTFCLIGRVGYLIGKLDFAPERICAVTFTNKAAEEITARLHATLGTQADVITRGTLHALCVQILREHGESIGIEKGFGIADETYQHLVLRRLRIARKRWGQVLTLFSRRRLQGYQLTPRDDQIYGQYRDYLHRRNLLDFDQLIERTAELFHLHPHIAEAIAARWDYVLVDEFQDLDPTQYDILKALVESHRNFFAVGDDEQSIFSWRGADPKVLQRFAVDFEIAEPVVLDQNRRCSVQIFETARRLLAVEPSLFDKRLQADRHSEHEVKAYAFGDQDDETAWLISDLATDREASGLGWGDYALLYRTHGVGNLLESAFVRSGIPCRLARGRALRDDPVVSYVVAALRLMRHPDDGVLIEAFAQVVLPEQLIERIRLSMAERDLDFLPALREFALANPKNDPDTKKAWRFIYHVENLSALYRMQDSVAGLVEELLSQRVGEYRNVLEDHHDELSDPAENPAVVELAGRLGECLQGGSPVWIENEGPERIALRGMLLQAGLTVVDYDAKGRPGGAGLHADPLTVFKALQLAHSLEFGHEFRDFVAFDLETTDNDIAGCEIVEIGAVRVRNGKTLDEFHALVRPRVPVSAQARAVHGYAEEDLEQAPYFEDVWPSFRDFIGRDLLVAHNALNFDVPVLRRMAAAQEGAGDLVFFDSLLLARSLYSAGARLEDLAHRFGIDTGRAHHALDDAVTLARVFGALTRLKVIRARKSALINLLDYLGLGLALDGDTPLTDETKALAELTRTYALGRYSDCLEFYETERARLDGAALPTVAEVIDRLGGRKLMERLRADRTAQQRYPEAYARLRGVIDTCQADTVDRSIERVLEHIALSTSEGAEIDRHRVNLLTLHSTKGLEFSRVYIVGVEDFQIPGYYQTIDNRRDEIEEARRLLYVGMTRAEDRLVLTRVDQRAGKDSGGGRFLEEMGLVAERM